MKTPSRASLAKAEPWIALCLCTAVLAAGVIQQFAHSRSSYIESPEWLPLAAAGLGAAAILVLLNAGPRWPGLPRVLLWGGLALMVWTAGGLLLDLLRLVPGGLMPDGVDWPGLVTRALALATFVVLARLALARPVAAASVHAATWYGYAAFALALPYPVLKTWWALGGTFGLRWAGADGLDGSFALWLPAVPWLMAAALSLLLATGPRQLPRRLLLLAGWFAVGAAATFGPAAVWSLITELASGDIKTGGMRTWAFGVVYGSWFLWAIAAAAATRSYQLRSIASRDVLDQATMSVGGATSRAQAT